MLSMRYKTVQEILDQAAELHARIAEQARQAAETQDRQRLSLVLDYLADHQASLKQAIQSFKGDAADRVLATWFDRSPEMELSALSAKALADADGVDELIETVMQFHDQIISLYGNLRDQAVVDEVRAVFSNLAELETHEKMELIQTTRQLQDI